MTAQCQYHPSQPAHFECYKCHTSFCSRCISKRTIDAYGAKKNMYFCPKCNIEAEPIGLGNLVAPFWKRLPQFFIYPFKLQPMIFILIIAGIGAVFSGSRLVNFLLWVAVIKYSLVTLNNSAQGKLSAPDISLKVLNEDVTQVFKQLGVLILVKYLTGWVFANFGYLAGILFMQVAVLSIPAMIMALVATDNMAQALNPLLLFRIISGIGKYYLLMYLFLTFFKNAPYMLAEQLQMFLPSAATYFIYFAATQYYTIMAYNLMGYVMFQYHEEIGYEVDYEEYIEQFSTSEVQQSPYAYLLNEVDILVQDGKIDEAINSIKKETSETITDLDLADKYYKLLKLKSCSRDILDMGSAYLNLLINNKKKNEACDFYKELKALDPEFNPTVESLIKVAEWMTLSREPKEAARALIRFIKEYPDHISLPDVYFSLAKIMHTRLDNHAKAKQILRHVLKRYPDHDITGTVKNYIEQMA